MVAVKLPLWVITNVICIVVLMSIGALIFYTEFVAVESALRSATQKYRTLEASVLEEVINGWFHELTTFLSEEFTPMVHDSCLASGNMFPREIRKFLQVNIAALPEVVGLIIGVDTGEAFGLYLLPSSEPKWVLSTLATNEALVSYNKDWVSINSSSFTSDNLSDGTFHYNATVRPWYTQAVLQASFGQVVVTPIFQMSQEGVLSESSKLRFISVAQASIKESCSDSISNVTTTTTTNAATATSQLLDCRNLTFVADVQVQLNHLQQLFTNISRPLNVQSLMFLFDLDSLTLIAWVTPSNVVMPTEISAFSSTILSELLSRRSNLIYLDCSTSGGSCPTFITTFELSIRSVDYVADVKQLVLPSNVHWIVVVATDVNVLMEGIQSKIPVLAGINAACIIGCSILMFFVLRSVTSPLLKFAKDLSLLCTMDFRQLQPFSPSCLREVNALIDALTILTSVLQRLRAFMPESAFLYPEAMHSPRNARILSSVKSVTEEIPLPPNARNSLVPARRSRLSAFVPATTVTPPAADAATGDSSPASSNKRKSITRPFDDLELLPAVQVKRKSTESLINSTSTRSQSINSHTGSSSSPQVTDFPLLNVQVGSDSPLQPSITVDSSSAMTPVNLSPVARGHSSSQSRSPPPIPELREPALSGIKRRLSAVFSGEMVIPTFLPPAPILSSRGIQRTVTVMYVDIKSFHDFAFQSTFAELKVFHSAYVNTLHQCVTNSGGVLDRVLGDRTFAVWNGARRCATAEVNAVKCGLDILPRWNSYLSGSTQPQSAASSASIATSAINAETRSFSPVPANFDAFQNFKLQCGLRIGIASSVACCGNMGSEAIRMFVVLGPAFGQAVVLQKLACKEMNVPILISERVARQVECLVNCIPSIVVRFAEMGVVVACYRPLREFPADAGTRTDNEWMYQMHLNSSVRTTTTTNTTSSSSSSSSSSSGGGGGGGRLSTSSSLYRSTVAPAPSADAQGLFNQYRECVRAQTTLPAAFLLPTDDDSDIVRGLRNTMASYPGGLKVMLRF